MTTLLQFNSVTIDKTGGLSFSIMAGETRLVKVASQEAKVATIEMALGELMPKEGEILLQGQPLQAAKPGSIGWVPAAGELVSNLKTWENVTLPLWYHGRHVTQNTEEQAAHWLAELGLAQQEWEQFMASPAARLRPVERKLAGLLRGLLHAPRVLVVDAALFEGVEPSKAQAWIAALEEFARAADGHAVLAVSHAATSLPWKTIE